MRIESTNHGDKFVYNFREIANPNDFDITRENRVVELDPCPFCGTNGKLSALKISEYFGTVCPKCLASGPVSTGWISAAHLWNNRYSNHVEEEKEPMLGIIEKPETTTSTGVETTINVRTNCINCINQPICKYSESYVECKSTIESAELPEVVKLEMSCKYFRSSITPKTTSPIGSRETSSTAKGIQIKHTKLNEESAGDEI